MPSRPLDLIFFLAADTLPHGESFLVSLPLITSSAVSLPAASHHPHRCPSLASTIAFGHLFYPCTLNTSGVGVSLAPPPLPPGKHIYLYAGAVNSRHLPRCLRPSSCGTLTPRIRVQVDHRLEVRYMFYLIGRNSPSPCPRARSPPYSHRDGRRQSTALSGVSF